MKKIAWLLILVVTVCILILSKFDSKGTNSKLSRPLDLEEAFFENREAIFCLKDRVFENNKSFEIQENMYADGSEYDIYCEHIQNVKKSDIVNYDEIIGTMQDLKLREIIYSCSESKVEIIPKEYTQESILFRTTEPSEDEFGTWTELESNWYHVYYPYT